MVTFGNRRWSIGPAAFAIFAAGAVSADLALARAADGPLQVHIETHKPGLAASAHLMVDGTCFGKKIELWADYLLPFQKPDVTVKFRGVQKRLGIETAFVRDLFSSRAALQYFIVCAGSGFQLTAWGTSFEDQEVARFVRALVTFDGRGGVADYDISAETYPFIRGHLRQ